MHTYLDMLFLEKCDADAIVNAIRNALVEKKLDIINLLVISIDKASLIVDKEGCFQDVERSTWITFI